MMTIDDVRVLLVAACAKAGSQRAWAERIGVSQQYLNDVMRHRRDPGPTVLRALGVEKVESYRRTHPDRLPPRHEQ